MNQHHIRSSCLISGSGLRRRNGAKLRISHGCMTTRSRLLLRFRIRDGRRSPSNSQSTAFHHLFTTFTTSHSEALTMVLKGACLCGQTTITVESDHEDQVPSRLTANPSPASNFLIRLLAIARTANRPAVVLSVPTSSPLRKV
jgi:hypothetical protein